MSTKPKIIIKEDPVLLAKQAVEIFADSAERAISKRGRFAVALSGGSTPRRMHKLLVTEPFVHNIPWGKTNIFWVDERCVPHDSNESNYGTAKRDFINKVPIPSAQVHFIPTSFSPRASADNYQKTLNDFFSFENKCPPRFDLIYLGMGTDGHIASLFPGQNTLGEKERLIVHLKGGDPNVERISMTLPLLNQARSIVFMITGKEKARTVQAVLENQKKGLPALKIRPSDGQLIWLLDRRAASLLSGDLYHDSI
jgi:6-phosphogluconolactonase